MTVNRPDWGAGTISEFPGLSPHVGVLRPHSKPPSYSPKLEEAAQPASLRAQAGSSVSSKPQVPPPPPSWQPSTVASANL